MLPTLQVERQLAAIEAASVPHMTSPARRDVLREHQATLGRDSKPVAATEADLASIRILVEHVPTVVIDSE